MTICPSCHDNTLALRESEQQLAAALKQIAQYAKEADERGAEYHSGDHQCRTAYYAIRCMAEEALRGDGRL